MFPVEVPQTIKEPPLLMVKPSDSLIVKSFTAAPVDALIIGALVTSGMEIPPKSLVLGSPAKVIRKITNTEEENIKKNALVYVEKALEYKNFYNKK